MKSAHPLVVGAFVAKSTNCSKTNVLIENHLEK